MSAEIFKFPIAERKSDEIERLRAGMREWLTEARGGITTLDFLVWREVELAMGVDDLRVVRNSAAAVEELSYLRLSEIPF